ncbi:MAG: hypothetical protein ACK4JE_05665, partial [Endomicrobiia bacterium]
MIPKMRNLSVDTVSSIEYANIVSKNILLKFSLGILLILLIIIARSEYWFLVLFLISVIFGMIFGFDLKKFFKKMKVLWIILISSFIVHIFLTPGNIIFNFGFLKITQQGLINSLKMIIRVVLLVFVSDVVVYDFSPSYFFTIFKSLTASNFFYLVSAVFGYLPSILENIKNTHPKTLKNLLNSLLVV